MVFPAFWDSWRHPSRRLVAAFKRQGTNSGLSIKGRGRLGAARTPESRDAVNGGRTTPRGFLGAPDAPRSDRFRARFGGDARRDIARILSIAVPVSVTLAQQKMTIDSILGITVGSIIEFEVPSEAELTLCVGSSPVGMGQAVKVGEKFGLRVNRIGNIQQRIEAMGPH